MEGWYTINLKRLVRCFLVLGFLAVASGCQSLYKTMGSTLVGYAESEATPFALSSPDAEMGCGLGEGFTLFILSFERVTPAPDRVGILMKTLASICSEQRAWEEELRYLRAVKAKSSSEAQDARTAQKRHMALAANRHYEGYMHMIKVFGEPGFGCPKLKNDDDEFLYLIGLVNGMQAVLNNIAADQASGVPMSIAAKVSRGAACLDAEKWWGTPVALEAAVWATMPGVNQSNIDPFERLRYASGIGLQQGVRLSQVFEAQIYWAQGKYKEAKNVVRVHAESIAKMPPDPRLKLMDRISTLHLQALSDQLWTEEKGYRTPMGRLGHFWDDFEEQVPDLDIDELL